jgi:hypothetical protein
MEETVKSSLATEFFQQIGENEQRNPTEKPP